MIVEIGHFALILALVVAFLQSGLPLVGAHYRHPGLMALAGPASQAQFVLTAVAFAALTYAYVVSDFSVANVVANSHSAKPMLYKITGVWGNHEGSMLLWVMTLALCGACVGTFGRNLPPTLKARVLGVQGMIGVGFLLFTLLTSNPFERLDPAPLDGRGLNPILQDPGLAFHPPFLYLGYVGFSIAFSFAMAALIEGRVDAAWARWVRPWTLAAWSFLTLGIALGSWWAYYELGWGGWWFWDPVENASFLPWLVGTALLHSAIVVEKRDALKRWTILLAILAFTLSLMGAFLVRSGVLTSVHTFATDPSRGLFILLILLVTAGGALALYAYRAPSLRSGAGLFRPISREGAVVLNNLLLTTAAVTVLVGTLYPLVLDTLGLGVISVGPPYFNATFVPLMIPLLAALVIGPLLPWKRGDLGAVLPRLKLAAAVAAVTAVGTLYAAGVGNALAALGLALAAWVFLGTFVEFAERTRLFRAPPAESWRRARTLPRAVYGMLVAHGATAVMVAGITASSAWQTEKILHMREGQTADIMGYRLTFQGVSMVPGPNYIAQRGTFSVHTTAGRALGHLTSERRSYPVQRQTTTEVGIRTTFLADLYVVLGESDGDRGWTVRLYHNPLVPWIWVGAILMFVGGAISLTDRRHRVGAPRRRREAAPAPEAPEAGAPGHSTA